MAAEAPEGVPGYYQGAYENEIINAALMETLLTNSEMSKLKCEARIADRSQANIMVKVRGKCSILHVPQSFPLFVNCAQLEHTYNGN